MQTEVALGKFSVKPVYQYIERCDTSRPRSDLGATRKCIMYYSSSHDIRLRLQLRGSVTVHLRRQLSTNSTDQASAIQQKRSCRYITGCDPISDRRSSAAAAAVATSAPLPRSQTQILPFSPSIGKCKLQEWRGVTVQRPDEIKLWWRSRYRIPVCRNDSEVVE